ncbi:RES family NAD+ phosphorylase [Prevotella sp. Rep29]|uniref:RES family NAD+ phosphorylase n=1 Tax=Prevotella sp. Rep29 TaxID=2691580 RepID=UPI001C6EB8D3|nr:RES family NAD+ phosphorylase [Prevotella sp. Rep29]QYR10458.1 RES domain-containing protein [Prevotella sp. Rep29]
MLICSNCFNDVELQISVSNESSVFGICDACGQEAYVVDIDIFADFFKELLHLFQPAREGVDIVGLLQKDWDIFVDDEVGKRIIGHFLSLDNYGYDLNEKVGYVDAIKSDISTWDDIKREVREEKRFFANLSYFDGNNMIEANTTIPQGTILYRARVIPSERTYLTKNDMGCPPRGKATAGRANPLGIPYLYLCKNEETTYYEVRALYLDKLAIGSFKTTRDLNILDFTSALSLYYAYNNSTISLSEVIAKQKILQLISSDLSKPLRRYDSELEYVPTQLICEYCKINGIDGICFNSSLHNGGVNVVLFDSSSAECIKVKSREIKDVHISR